MRSILSFVCCVNENTVFSQSSISSDVSAASVYSWTFQCADAWRMQNANGRSELVFSITEPASGIVEKSGPSSFERVVHSGAISCTQSGGNQPMLVSTICNFEK